jgi:HSP20 family molecular chaperone IbpA
MALLNQFLFPSSIIRPVHMTFTGPHPSLRSILHTIENPYYSKSSHHDHENVLYPSFDVRETDSTVFLEGEFPGAARKEDITIEKLGPRTLFVESKVTHFDVESLNTAMNTYSSCLTQIITFEKTVRSQLIGSTREMT